MREFVIGLVGLIGLIGLINLTTPAHAQRRGQPQGPSPEEMEKKRQAAEIDQKYRAALKQSGSETHASTKKDPWSSMRAPSGSQQ